jgi:hypothetical protein
VSVPALYLRGLLTAGDGQTPRRRRPAQKTAGHAGQGAGSDAAVLSGRINSLVLAGHQPGV